MQLPLPAGYPKSFVAGDTVEFDVANPDYLPADGWSLTIIISTSTPAEFDAVVDGDHFHVTIPGEGEVVPNSDIATGIFRMSEVYTKDAVRKTARTWRVHVMQNPSKAVDPSWAQQTLEACQTAITSLASKKLKQTTVDGQNYVFQDLPELIKLRDRCLFEIGAANQRAGLPGIGGRKVIQTRFA